MKLYATVTSERATKGQGGNKYIEIILAHGSRDNSIQEYRLLFTSEVLTLLHKGQQEVTIHHEIAKKQKDNGCYECGKIKHLSPFETGYGENRMLCDDCYPEAK